MAATDLPTIRPDWRRKPSGDDLAEAYPEKAQREGVGGKAVIKCHTSLDGTLHDCLIVSEAPAGYGFGMAALEMSELFEMEPGVKDGVQQTGTVQIPIAFKIPPQPAGDSFRLSEPDLAGAVVLGAVLALSLVAMAANDWMQVRAGAPKVRLGRGLVFALRFIGRAWLGVPGPLAVCLAIALAELACAIAYPDNVLIRSVFTVPMLVAQVFAYAACHRLALQGCSPERMRLGRFGFQARAVERDVALSWLIVGVIFVAAIILAALVGAIVAILLRMVMTDATYPMAAGAVVGLAVGAILYAAGRLYFVPAAFAVQGSDGLEPGWRLGRGTAFGAVVATLSALVLLFVAILVVTAPLYFLNLGFRSLAGAGLIATIVSSATVLPFSAGLISYFYLETSGAAEQV